MKIQSFSICVPTNGCVNKCKFCVSRMHENQYPNLLCDKVNQNLARQELIDRLSFVSSDNSSSTVVLTGTGEPLQNMAFLTKFNECNRALKNPFMWIELQTSGVMLDKGHLEFLRAIGVKTISLSISDLFDDERNAEIIGMPDALKFKLEDVCKLIKDMNFNLRLSLNMTKAYHWHSVGDIHIRAKQLGANQITFRKLYRSIGGDAEINNWIKDNKMDDKAFKTIRDVLKKEAIPLEILPFGAVKYSFGGMGVVLDEDCMSKEIKDTYRYLILRENCKLYSRWDMRSSLVF